MAEPVNIDPRAYSGTYKLIGGAPALDFANLVSYRDTERAHDWLQPTGNAAIWADAAGVVAPLPDEVPELGLFRELVARVFLAVADGESPDPSDLAEIGSVAASTWQHRRLTLPVGAPAAVWTDDAPTLRGTLAVDAAALLTDPDALGRIEACGECRWLFLDTSRNRSRRWCDPADCGNRARQRRHYRRHRPT